MIRTYTIKDLSKDIYFCPLCHRRVSLPFKGNIKITSSMTINCGSCGRGKVKLISGEVSRSENESKDS